MTYLGVVPVWVWSAVVAVIAQVCILAFAYRAHARAERWKAAAREAANKARLWQVVAEGRARNVHSKRTVVAPQYHAPRAGQST